MDYWPAAHQGRISTTWHSMRENHPHPLYRRLEGIQEIVNDRGCVIDRHLRFVPCRQRMPHGSAYEGAVHPTGSGWNLHARVWKRLCKSSQVQEIDLHDDSKNSWMGYRGRNRPLGPHLCLQPPSLRKAGCSNAPERERKTSAKQGNPWLSGVRNYIPPAVDSLTLASINQDGRGRPS